MTRQEFPVPFSVNVLKKEEILDLVAHLESGVGPGFVAFRK